MHYITINLATQTFMQRVGVSPLLCHVLKIIEIFLPGSAALYCFLFL